ncbi:MAG: CDP-alcohol phosphatidyltransferase family protein [Verrucomicrobiota bacterium]
MNRSSRRLDGILIFADESAEWRCAGLRQIDRLLFALDERLGGVNDVDPIPICIAWMAERPTKGLAQNGKRSRLSLEDNLAQFSSKMQGESCVAVISTRLVLNRTRATNAARNFPDEEHDPVLMVSGSVLAGAVEGELKKRLFDQLQTVELAASRRMREQHLGNQDWFYLESPRDLGVCERNLLQSTAKSQDGFVSRVVNRPISRAVTSFLLRFPLLPNQWTLLLTAIPIAGSLFLLRGDYLGFALGAILFQLHSALDGCDGEIARVKYLESERGRKLDEVCDRFATLLYAVCLGIGLSRQSGIAGTMQWFYLLEGMIAALLIGVSETLLTRTPMDENPALAAGTDELYPQYVNENRQSFNQGDQLKLWVIKNSGMLFAGQRAASFFGELTKRDVFNFAFMLMALCGRASWVLHIIAVTACVIVVLTLKSLLAPPLEAKSAP